MENIKEMKDTCVAYGYFDGVHKGHLAVAKKVVEVAKEKGLTPMRKRVRYFLLKRKRNIYSKKKGYRKLLPILKMKRKK